MGRGIPDRWLEYTKIGKPMESDGLEVKFISFKVPLKQELTISLEKKETFSPMELMDICNEKNIKLGLIIDLTFTKRYYKPEMFTSAGIKYVKIPVEGQMVPRKARTDKFAETVKNYLETCEKKDTVIGVHCTHGVNRTGHVICKYLIEHEKMDAQEAIDLFASSRGHSIERDIYIDHLKTGQLPETEKESYYEKDSQPQWDNRSNNASRHHRDFDGGGREWNDNKRDMHYYRRDDYYPPANRGDRYYQPAYERDRYYQSAYEGDRYYQPTYERNRYSESAYNREHRAPHHRDRFYYDDPYHNDNYSSFDGGYAQRSYRYERTGPSRDYDGRLEMDKYGPSSRQDGRRGHYDAGQNKRGYDDAVASTSSGSRKRSAALDQDEYTSPEKRSRSTHS